MKLQYLAIAAVGATLLASCSTPPARVTRTAEAQRALDRALAGRVAGKPVRCISNYPSANMQIIDDWTILFKDGRTIYLQNPRGGCPGIESHRNIMVTRLFGTNQRCSGDINHLVDPTSGIAGGSCIFGPFVPYRKVS